LRLLLTNQLAAADAFWAAAIDSAGAERARAAGEHDPRGAFQFVGALTAFLHGVATLENDQLSQAGERLKHADELIDADSDWAGKTVLKGLCMLLVGMVQVLQHHPTNGIWQILRSWLWLRLLEEEALPYQGPERSLVRSTALLALGVFNLVVSLMPPLFMRTATWCSGLSGDREVAISYLRTCFEEEGVLAPFAVMVLVGYQVDVRTFLGEPRSEEVFTEADRWLTWAEEKFPNGVFFTGLRANFCAVSRDVAKAQEISDSFSALAEELPALGLVMHARRASYAQASLDWSRAAAGYRDAIALYRRVGRRSLVPAMAANAALCHHLAGQEDGANAKEAGDMEKEMLDLVVEYRDKKDKKNWDTPDRWAIALAEAARAGTWDPELELYQMMAVKHRSTMFLSFASLDVLLGKLDELEQRYAGEADKRCRCAFLRAEILRQASRFEDALTAAFDGIDLEPELSEDGAKGGYIQYMHFVVASCQCHTARLGEAQDTLRKLDALSRDHQLYYSVLMKTTQLSRRLGVEMKDAYLEVAVPSRSTQVFEAKIPSDLGLVEWDWTLEDYSISFSATFVPADGSASVNIQSVEKHESTEGPVMYRFETASAGKLELSFDNTFSILRSKKVFLRVQPEHVVLETV